MKVRNTMSWEASGLSFVEVCRATRNGMHNLGSYLEELFESFLSENGLRKESVVLIADHSVGTRYWKAVEGHKPLYFEEVAFNGGWHILTEENAEKFTCISATSGSELSANRQEDGTWTLVLEVPMENDEPYLGWYWRSFLEGLGLVNPRQEEEPVPANG